MIEAHLPGNSALVHFETCAKIEDNKKHLVTPTANVFQRRLYEAYETLLAVAIAFQLDFEIRILGLKIRQCGGTTASCHIIYHHSQRFPTDSVVIADVNANSKAIVTKIERYANTDRFAWGNQFDPRGGSKLAWANGSSVEITSAETPNAGISRTRQAALFSEAAKYPRGGVKDCKKIMAGVLPSVNLLGIAETTPEGASGWFYDQYQKALSLDDFIAALKRGVKSPGNGWVKVFAAWFEFPENALRVTPSERELIMRTLSPREQNGITRYNWIIEQIAWRRHTMSSECGGSEESFDEYYPEDEVSCFLSSGRPRFNMGAVIRMEKLLKRYSVKEGHLSSQRQGTIFIPDSATSTIQIFEEPKEGCRYLVWCDPATGEDQTMTKDPDRHSIGVLRAPHAERDGLEKKMAVVARVRPPCTTDGDTVAEHIISLSRHYGDALVVLEVNMGLHVLKALKDAGVPIYKREVIDPFDRDTPKIMYGWKLKDRDQRRGVIDCLAAHIRDGTIDIPCPHIIGEFKTFVIDKNGKEQARSGTHDDDVLGLAMGCYSIGAATIYRQSFRRKQKPKDWKRWKRS